jgi:thiol-disulfide isomerase/thioredoxin
MADLNEPATGGEIDVEEPAGTTATPARGRRTLDGRTLAIAALVGLIAALLTALIGNALLSDDQQKGGMELEEAEQIDTGKLLAQPLDTVDGGTTDLESFREGKPLLVNLFASNCVPCVDEMPLLTQAQADHPDITFVGVATQDDVAKAKALAKRTGITSPWALDPTGELSYEAKGAGMPTTVLLSADGQVLGHTTGAFDDQAELEAFLDQAR